MKMISESLKLNQKWQQNPVPQSSSKTSSTDLSSALGAKVSVEGDDEELENFFSS